MPALAATDIANREYKVCTSPVPDVFAGPLVPELEFVEFASKAQAHAALDAGLVDFTDYPKVRGAPALPGQRIHPCDLLGYYYAAYNCGDGFTGKKTVRQALNRLFAQARVHLIEKTGQNPSVLIEGVMPASYGWIVNPYVPKYAPDASGSLEELSEAARLQALTSLILVYDQNDDTSVAIAEELEALISPSPLSLTLRPTAEVEFEPYVRGDRPWHIMIGFNFIQDNLCRWNPGLTKLRTSIDWLCDFTSSNSATRNFPRLNCPEFDACAERFLASLNPTDLRPVGVLRTQLDFRWNNAEYWAAGGDLPPSADALLLSWKLQWILADESPVFPLIKPQYDFHAATSTEGVFNADCDTGGVPYPGGPVSYWTFQRIHHRDQPERGLKFGLSGCTKHLNPLAAGPYQDTVVWARIFESLTGLNPILLAINVGEDCVNLASKYVAEFVTRGPVQEVLTFHVRDGVKWHDSRAFSTDDVAFSILSIFGAAGREIAKRSATTDHLREFLTNDVEIPSWIDLVKSLDHIVLASGRLELHLRSASRYAQEWFGDLPMLPMHVWSKLGSNYLEPTFSGRIGLQHIGSSASAPAGYSPWNGLIGTGPFRWIGAGETEETERHSRLVRFEHYHRGAVQ